MCRVPGHRVDREAPVRARQKSVARIYGRLVVPIGGVWSRPFVSDGDPAAAEVALIGFNPATEIPASVDRALYLLLLPDRARFEAFYAEERRRQGRSSTLSPTRRRMALVRASFPGKSVVETNVNALPSRNKRALKAMPEAAGRGAEIARSLLRMIRPRIVLIHDQDALDCLLEDGLLELRNAPVCYRGCHRFHANARFNGRRVKAYLLPSLGIRGVRDTLFADITAIDGGDF